MINNKIDTNLNPVLTLKDLRMDLKDNPDNILINTCAFTNDNIYGPNSLKKAAGIIQ